MKKIYNEPCINIKNIDTEIILEMSIYVNNSYDDEYFVEDSSEILINKNSVWD